MSGQEPGRRASGRSDRLALVILLPLLFVFVGLVSVLYITHTTARVEGDSMLPDLLPEDILLVTRGYERPVKGDVVVLHAPNDPRLQPGSELVKRVIAIPGDEIEIIDGIAYVNGRKEEGSYKTILAPKDKGMPLTTVPAGTVILLGDNRPVSLDSRYIGPVALDLVIGRVVAIIAPVNRFGRVD